MRSAHGLRGFTLVELMIGVVIGLVVLAGALAMLAKSGAESRRLLLETRLNQDLRAAMDVVTRDLRRAGHWQGATAGIWVRGGPDVPPRSAYRAFHATTCNALPAAASAPIPASAASYVCYDIAQDGDNVVQDNEHNGFHLTAGVLYAVLGGGSQQALTDASSITISRFVVSPFSRELAMDGFCRAACSGNCPRVVVREFEVTLQGHLPGDASFQRELRSRVRVRNDHVDGVCPGPGGA